MSEGDVGMDAAHTGGMKRQRQQMRRRRRRRGGGAEGYCAENTQQRASPHYSPLFVLLVDAFSMFIFSFIYLLSSDQ